MFVNPIACALVLPAVYRLIGGERRRAQLQNFDFLGAVTATGGMLLLVYTLVKAPTVGWGTARTIGQLAGALALLAGFVINERRTQNPLAPLSIFRINGLGFSDATQLIAFAGFLAVFFFLTLYMQNVLGYSPIQTGAAYIPLCFAIGISAGITSQLISRIGTRPLIVGGAVIAAGGLYWLSRIPVHGSFLSDLLPGMLVMSLGIGAVFVSATTAANADVTPDTATLAAALLNASQQLGGASDSRSSPPSPPATHKPARRPRRTRTRPHRRLPTSAASGASSPRRGLHRHAQPTPEAKSNSPRGPQPAADTPEPARA
jgi:hypothetical protein